MAATNLKFRGLKLNDAGTMYVGQDTLSVITSAGAADSGKIPLLNSLGKLDSSVIPPPLGGSGGLPQGLPQLGGPTYTFSAQQFNDAVIGNAHTISIVSIDMGTF